MFGSLRYNWTRIHCYINSWCDDGLKQYSEVSVNQWPGVVSQLSSNHRLNNNNIVTKSMVATYKIINDSNYFLLHQYTGQYCGLNPCIFRKVKPGAPNPLIPSLHSRQCKVTYPSLIFTLSIIIELTIFTLSPIWHLFPTIDFLTELLSPIDSSSPIMLSGPA